MRWSLPVLLVLVLSMSGCADSSMVLKGQVDKYQQQQQALTTQTQQLQARAAAMDRDLQEHTAMLAQARQQNKVLEDQLAAVREQVRGATAQLQEARSAQQSSANQVQALTASMRRRGGVAITPNNSLLQTLPAIHYADVHVRRDGDVIRIELPGSQLFDSGSSRLSSGGTSLVTSVASEIKAIYPNQMIGIEGHSDSDPITGRQWQSNHELSTARAMAVYQTLTSRGLFQPDQLFIVGHGSNHPVASNATIDGKRRNRRVELVVYPEKRG